MATGISKNSEVKVNYKGSNGGVSELLKELWNAAVALRGSIDSAEYKLSPGCCPGLAWSAPLRLGNS